MRRSAPCNPRAVHICRYVIKYFPTIWYLYCGHCCICIQSRYMHISPVSKLTSPLPPAHRVSIGQTNSSDFFFFFLPLSNKFAKYPRFHGIPIFNPSEIFRKILLARWEKITQISDFPNYLIRFTSVAILYPPIWSQNVQIPPSIRINFHETYKIFLFPSNRSLQTLI